FGGIGVQFTLQNDTVMVVDVISGGPSQKVGILPGDRIVRVDDTVIYGKKVTNQQVMQHLRGPKGTKVKVGIVRKGIRALLNFNIVRDEIPIYSVDVAYKIDNKTGFVKVSRFSDKTYDEFMVALKKLKSQGVQDLIIDLRGNPGGALNAVIQMANEFLGKNDLILFTKGNARPRSSVRADGRGIWKSGKIAVLIDEFSASASEIFAGAIQDNDRGTIIGRRSFGKGLVQEQIPLTDGSALRLTVARYYTPSGRSIQKPYNKGKADEYYKDIEKRYKHGEFTQKDSIKFSSSLKFKTKSGRTVYGGGGIMPDIFVGADTTGYSPFYNKVLQNGLIYEFAFSYADRNRDKLRNLHYPASFDQYLEKQKLFGQFLTYCKKKGVSPRSGDLKKSGSLIQTQLKALTTRNVIGDDGFYPLIQREDKTLVRAISVLEKK
ncbi:MAG: S41 family peptidase, partial [Bacteroidota bacterium]|nr:S41 family peptidase [Bacteroidota bacterium]